MINKEFVKKKVYAWKIFFSVSKLFKGLSGIRLFVSV